MNQQNTAANQDKLPDADDVVEPTFVPEGVVLPGLPAFVDVDNVVSLYGWQLGESLEEAIARTRKKRQESDMNQQNTAANQDAAAVESSSDMELPPLAFLEDDGPSDIIPPFITTTNARELFDLQPGETVAEAAARRARERE